MLITVPPTDKDTLDHLLKLVKEVRAAQKTYFKARGKYASTVMGKLLEDSKETERKLDFFIELLEKPKETQQKLL
jgi:hypothetical protein